MYVKDFRPSRRIAACAVVGLSLVSVAWGQSVGSPLMWQVVVNNGDLVPGDPANRPFNSYSQPSVSVEGRVVFRGRSRGGEGTGQPAHGVYLRDMPLNTGVVRVFDRNTEVPQPNNLGSTFIEPPSIPRIDMWSNTIASRGNHQPVYQYLLPDLTETRAGTTGVYTTPFGPLMTGASNLGAVPGGEPFAVPGTNLKFDVFPGSPAVTDTRTLVVKGNYTDSTGTSRTGVYFRDLQPAIGGGDAPMVLIANSQDTYIPGTGILFGSTAPPSAAGRLAVFSGFDNEAKPELGGIYLAPLTMPRPPLTPLVRIGGQVPGEPAGTAFNKLGEGLSFDGRFVAFWGAWGKETKKIILKCPEDGNQALIDYCTQQYPYGYKALVPLRQGIFVHDILTGQTFVVAKTPNHFDDFVSWNFSGRVPGTGEGDDEGEAARWRSTAFVAVSGLVDGNLADPSFHVAFKARKGVVRDGSYVNPVDGIYLGSGPGIPSFTSVVVSGTNGTLIDPMAVYDDDENPETPPVPLPVTAMGVERDGFRGNLLTITVTMANESAGWAGIYLTTVPNGGLR